jgi:bifunctional N-acetylglucosamine-1-phosphate-uridyltransferase/glucosamine-1-phosphate-acetyltransferase GlmU-like protein
VVTRNVPADALAVSRGEQTIKPGWAKRLRQFKGLGKKKVKTPKK